MMLTRLGPNKGNSMEYADSFPKRENENENNANSILVVMPSVLGAEQRTRRTFIAIVPKPKPKK
jgi:hypothetical protein